MGMLRYFALCQAESSLDSIYYFIGTLKEKPPLRETPEGTLHWVKLEDGATLAMTAHTKAFYLHWLGDLDGSSIHRYIDPTIQVLL